jgi:hypothetical protein
MARSCVRTMDVLRHGRGSFPRRSRRIDRARARSRIAGSLPAEWADVACFGSIGEGANGPEISSWMRGAGAAF